MKLKFMTRLAQQPWLSIVPIANSISIAQVGDGNR